MPLAAQQNQGNKNINIACLFLFSFLMWKCFTKKTQGLSGRDSSRLDILLPLKRFKTQTVVLVIPTLLYMPFGCIGISQCVERWHILSLAVNSGLCFKCSSKDPLPLAPFRPCAFLYLAVLHLIWPFEIKSGSFLGVQDFTNIHFCSWLTTRHAVYIMDSSLHYGFQYVIHCLPEDTEGARECVLVTHQAKPVMVL